MRIFNRFISPPWMGIALTAILGMPIQAQHVSYTFTKLSTLGDPAPGGDFHINDFEPGALNNRGDAIYGTDLSGTVITEGVFLLHAGQISRLFRDSGLLGQTALNDEGDGAFAFNGVSTGVYRYSHSAGTVTPVMVPGVTPAPGGGTFAGVGFNTSLNNRGDLVFTGILPQGYGVFKADGQNRITSIVRPGDAAPGGKVFDFAGNAAWINDGGDVAFVAHLADEPPLPDVGHPSGIYVKRASTGNIQSIAHAGDPAPCGVGQTFAFVYSPILNDAGDVVFQGDLLSLPGLHGVFLDSKGKIEAVACPGGPMPGGRTLSTTANYPNDLHINNSGEVVFGALLDNSDTGVFVQSHGSLVLVAGTGTVIPGVGKVSQSPNVGAVNNARGQVLFDATLSDGAVVLLLATPSSGGDDH